MDNVDNDMSLEDVAASLIVRPEAKEEKPAPAQASEEATADETAENVSSDEGQSEEVEAESTAEEPAEGEETKDEEDVDVDELEVDVTIDGQEAKVKLKDLKANYSGNKAIEKRLQEASEARTQATELSKRMYVALQEQAVRLAKLDEVVSKVAEPDDINWEELKRTNLPRYLLERDKQREAQERRQKIAEEQARVNAERERLEVQARQEYANEQARQLVTKLPDLADPVKAQATFTKLTKAASSYGYAAEEVSSVMDHRAMLVLNDAMKYQELMSKQANVTKKIAKPTALMRPNASTANRPVSSAKKLQDALLKKARATGKADDVAATLLVRKK